MESTVEKLEIGKYRQIVSEELTPENKIFSQWIPHPVVDSAIQPSVGKLRPWTKDGSVYQNFFRNFYSTLVWYKLVNISQFEQTSWNVDEKLIENISNKFSFLIKHALKNIDDNFFDHERNLKPKSFFQNYDPYYISRYTAIDYLFQNITNRTIKNVLDFGSGIGRQAFQWVGSEGRGDDVNFVSVEVTESLYLLQNEIYSLLFPKILKEYFYEPEFFQKLNFSEQDTSLYHLPTWKMNLLPSDSFDLIICVQVLNEINVETLEYLLAQFKRIAKKNCLLYIRDNEIGYNPSHNKRVGRLLLRHGFELIFRYTGLESRIEGKPRVWSYTGVEKSNANFNLKNRLARAISYPSGNYNSKILIKSIITSIRDWGLPI